MPRRTRKNRRLRKTRRRRKQRRTRRRRRRRGGEIKKAHGLKKKFPGRIKVLNREWKERGGGQFGVGGCAKSIEKWNKLYRHTGRRIRHPFLYSEVRKCRQKYKTLFNKFFPFQKKKTKKNEAEILRLKRKQRIKKYRDTVRYKNKN